MKFGQICFKVLPLMQCKVMQQIFHSFCSIVKKWSKLDQKTQLLAFFHRFFDHTLLHPMSEAPSFLPNQRSHAYTYSW